MYILRRRGDKGGGQNLQDGGAGSISYTGGVSTNYATSTMHPSDLCNEKPEMHLRCQMGLILRLSAKVGPSLLRASPETSGSVCSTRSMCIFVHVSAVHILNEQIDASGAGYGRTDEIPTSTACGTVAQAAVADVRHITFRTSWKGQ